MLPADSPFASLPAPGPHPATAALRAYAAGTLAPAEQYRIEAHALDCACCADLLAGFSLTDAATTNRAVATLRTRLQARLRARLGAAAPAPPAVLRGAWPRVAAAAALLLVAAGSLWTWEHRAATRPPAAAARPEATQLANPATAGLPPAGAGADAPAPAAQPVAGAPAPAPAQVADKPRARVYVVARPARPQQPARLRRTRLAPVAAVYPAAAPQPAAAEQAMPAAAPEASAAPTARSQQPTPLLLAATNVAATPVNPASAELATEKTRAASVASAQGAAVASQYNKAAAPMAEATAPIAETAAPVAGVAPARVANASMPATLAINPAPVGGPVALRNYLRRAAADFKPENDATPLVGTVRVRFSVGADGRLSNLSVVSGLRPDYDSEALRIVREGPAWQPGVAAGRRAPRPVEVVVSF